MKKEEYLEQKENLKKELQKIQARLIELDEYYAKDCMERNGYEVGQRINIRGREGIVVGATMGYKPQLNVHKIRKDGTMSDLRDYALCIYLKEE